MTKTPEATVEFFVPERPVPKVRTTQRGAWSPAFKRCQEFEGKVRKCAENAVGERTFDQTRKWILHFKFLVPQLRGDPDNLVKSVIDAMRGPLFYDDSVKYIRKISATFYHDKEKQGIHVAAYQEKGEEDVAVPN